MSASHNTKINTSIEGEKIVAYPKPISSRLLDAYAKENSLSKSKVVAESVKQFFDRLPSEKRAQYLKNKY
jgi:hypothetical protein